MPNSTSKGLDTSRGRLWLLKFGSLEYMNEVMKRTNADAEYERLSKEETGSFTMLLGAEPANGIPKPIVVGYREEKGKILEVWEGERQTDFVLSGPYGVWVDISAIFSGYFRVQIQR